MVYLRQIGRHVRVSHRGRALKGKRPKKEKKMLREIKVGKHTKQIYTSVILCLKKVKAWGFRGDVDLNSWLLVVIIFFFFSRVLEFPRC